MDISIAESHKFRGSSKQGKIYKTNRSVKNQNLMPNLPVSMSLKNRQNLQNTASGLGCGYAKLFL